MFSVLLVAIQNFIEGINAKYREMMMHLSFSILKDYHLAEDNVQEVLMILNRKEKILKDPDSPGCKNYIYTVTRNLAIKTAKKKSNDPVTFFDESALYKIEGEPDITAFTDQYGFGMDIQEALHTISQEDRDLICYRYGGGHSYREIADMMGISASTLRKRMERIRQKLQEVLESNDG